MAGCLRINPPISKELIRPHQTDTIPSKTGISKTYIVINNNTNRFEKGDTVGQITYDKSNRVIEDDSNPYRTYKWTYDSSGIVTYLVDRDWDVYLDYKVTYREVVDSSKVYQQFTEVSYGYSYIETYLFDKTNRLAERISIKRESDLWNWLIQAEMRQNSGLFKVDTTERYTINKYFYDSYGEILKMECWTDSREFTGRKSSQMFYFTDHRLDSTKRTFDQYHYDVRSYFDYNGLERRRVYNDTLILTFVHI